MLLRPKRRYQPSTLLGVKFQNIPRHEKVQNYVNFLFLAASRTQRLNLTCRSYVYWTVHHLDS